MAKLSLVAFAAMVVTTGAAQANCSNATIQGDWTFTVHGNALTLNGATSLAFPSMASAAWSSRTSS
jgi:hypothetical protein